MSFSSELVDRLTDDIVIDILDEAGSPVMGSGHTSSGEEYLIFKTVCHGGDSSKLYYYKESKSFQCWTNCGHMSIFDLIKKIKGYRDDQFSLVLNYLKEKMGYTFSSKREGIIFSTEVGKNIQNDIMKMEQAIEERSTEKKIVNIEKFYDKKILKYFDSNTFYQGWIDEGISEESMRKYQISYYWPESHIIIPHFNINNDLVGIRRRSLNPEDSKNKYMPAYVAGSSYEHPLGLNLYGINFNKEAIKKSQTVILAEGEKSVLLSDTYFGEDSITLATCGFNITDWQIRQLTELEVKTVYIAFDKDFDLTQKELYRVSDPKKYTRLINYEQRLLSLGKKLSILFNVYLIIDQQGPNHPLGLKIKDSPFDRGKEVFENLYKKARLIK